MRIVGSILIFPGIKPREAGQDEDTDLRCPCPDVTLMGKWRTRLSLTIHPIGKSPIVLLWGLEMQEGVND
eukprot:8623935-Pyramimonas_sp.AAC.1